MRPRESFDPAALDYDKARPGYPEELIEDIVRISGIPAGGKILEVGCGTGQATLPFASRGYRMLCIDIGGELLSIARRKLEGYPDVDLLKVSFEDWEVEPLSFDLVMSATAFHWIPPEIGYPKAAQAMKESGHIALLWNMHPTPYTGFFEDVQRVYRRVVPEWGDPSDRPTEEKIAETKGLIDGTGLFEEVVVRRYPWSRLYSRDLYLRLLNTYSDHRGLDEARMAKLYSGIGALIDEEHGGTIERPYLSVLYIARKKHRRY